jgi:hypothetical protein
LFSEGSTLLQGLIAPRLDPEAELPFFSRTEDPRGKSRPSGWAFSEMSGEVPAPDTGEETETIYSKAIPPGSAAAPVTGRESDWLVLQRYRGSAVTVDVERMEDARV